MAWAAPTQTKTWTPVSSTITAGASHAATCKTSMRTWVNSHLLAVPSSSCVGSSNGVTAGIDGTNRWSSDSDIVWAASGARSWIIVKLAGIASNFQILIALSNSATNTYQAQFYVSPNAGFTGGGTTSNPSATDQEAWGTQSWNTFASTATNANQAVHTVYSSDGAHVRSFWCRSGVASAAQWFDVPDLIVDGTNWPQPHLSMFSAASGAEACTQALLANAASSAFGTRNNSTSAINAATLIGLATGTAASGSAAGMMPARTAKNTLANAWECSPVFVGITAVSLLEGTHGTMRDLYWRAGTGTVATGDTAPSVGAAQWVVFGDFLVPWSGPAPTVTP